MNSKFSSCAHALAVSSVVLMSAAFSANAGAVTRAEYSKEKDRIDHEYKTAKTQCKALTGNEKDVCKAEAKAAERRADAKAEADYKGTPKAKAALRKVGAEADYLVARAKCGVQTGAEKSTCINNAKAAKDTALSDANASVGVSSGK
ncbi:hypothetical protein BH11PSE11_BH11PSE11_17950 [soil metagenome]